MPGYLEMEWANYVRDVVPATATPVQISAARKVFYCGASAMFSLLITQGENRPDAVGRLLETLHRELLDYLEEISHKRNN